MMMSPFSRCGVRCAIISSTVSPAFTISITRRGLFKACVSSSMECVPTTWVPAASWPIKSSTLETVRLKTATRYPWSFMFRTRFWPITARPIRPMSQVGDAMSSILASLIYTRGQEAAVHRDRLAGDEAGRVGRQQHGHADQLFQLAEAAHGGTHFQFAAALGPVQKLRIQIGAEDPRRDGVHVDSVARPLDRQVAGERQHTRLRRGVGGHFQEADERCQRRDVDDPA